MLTRSPMHLANPTAGSYRLLRFGGTGVAHQAKRRFSSDVRKRVLGPVLANTSSCRSAFVRAWVGCPLRAELALREARLVRECRFVRARLPGLDSRRVCAA